jgi:hypothetical protein
LGEPRRAIEQYEQSLMIVREVGLDVTAIVFRAGSFAR